MCEICRESWLGKWTVTRTYRELVASGEGGKRTRSQFPDGTLRRSSSKKLKMKLTLVTAEVGPASGALRTATRLPSGCTSYPVNCKPRIEKRPGDQGRGLSPWKESPEIV